MKRTNIFILITILLFCNVVPSYAKDFNSQASIVSTVANTTESMDITWPKGPSVVAESAIIMEASTGVILYSKNANNKHYPASITKIMTALLAIENSSLSETITFSKDAIYGTEAGSSGIGAMVGEELTMEQCLYAIMLESANEVSTAVGEHIAGDITSFTKMMNAKAKELGCKNTHFANANGLHNDDHYTTAYDMALISQAAMKNTTFRTITGTKRYTVPITNKYKEIRYFCNHQQMLYANKYPQYEYDGCIGGKTGYTQKAGNTLVTFAKRGDMELICVVMKTKAPTLSKNQYTDSSSLLDFAFNNYKVYNIAANNDTKILANNLLFSRFNSLFNQEITPLKISGTGNIVLPNTANITDTTQKVEFFSNVDLIEGQNKIGSISYTYGDRIVGATDVIFNKTETSKLVSITPSSINNHGEYIASNNFISGPKDLKPMIVLGIVGTILLLFGLTYLYLRIFKKHFFSRFHFDKKKKTKLFKNDFMNFKP